MWPGQEAPFRACLVSLTANLSSHSYKVCQALLDGQPSESSLQFSTAAAPCSTFVSQTIAVLSISVCYALHLQLCRSCTLGTTEDAALAATFEQPLQRWQPCRPLHVPCATLLCPACKRSGHPMLSCILGRRLHRAPHLPSLCLCPQCLPGGKGSEPDVRGTIELRGVTFRYPTRPEVGPGRPHALHPSESA